MRFFALIPAVFAAAVAAVPVAPSPLVAEIDAALDDLGLGLHNSIKELVHALGIQKTDSQLTWILKHAVHVTDGAVNGVDDVVDKLLWDLGLGDLVAVTDDLEEELDLKPTNTIGHLLTSLHLI